MIPINFREKIIVNRVCLLDWSKRNTTTITIRLGDGTACSEGRRNINKILWLLVLCGV